MPIGSRRKERVKSRRQERKRKLKDMARKGLRVKKNKGPRLGKGRNSYLCGPCSRSKGVQVRHKHNSDMGRAHFTYPTQKAYLLPKPEKPKAKPLRGEKDATDVQ